MDSDRRLLLWAQPNLHSLRVVRVPVRLNQGADMLSWGNVSLDEWTLHPQIIRMIWSIFVKAEVDLVASEDNSHCPICFLRDRDKLVHEWPSPPLYHFPPVVLRGYRRLAVLVAPLWQNQPWFPELTQLLSAALLPIPLRMEQSGTPNQSSGPFTSGPSTEADGPLCEGLEHYF